MQEFSLKMIYLHSLCKVNAVLYPVHFSPKTDIYCKQIFIPFPWIFPVICIFTPRHMAIKLSWAKRQRSRHPYLWDSSTAGIPARYFSDSTQANGPAHISPVRYTIQLSNYKVYPVTWAVKHIEIVRKSSNTAIFKLTSKHLNTPKMIPCSFGSTTQARFYQKRIRSSKNSDWHFGNRQMCR